MTNPNDRLRLLEVPFTATISGTRLVIAADDAKAAEIVEETMIFDDEGIYEEGVLWDVDEQVVLKDGLRGSISFGKPEPFKGDIRDFEDQFDNDQMALVEHPPEDTRQATESEEKKSEQRTGDATSATTSAGAVAPDVNRSQPTQAPPPRPNVPPFPSTPTAPTSGTPGTTVPPRSAPHPTTAPSRPTAAPPPSSAPKPTVPEKK